jgi:hypothetical protein
VRTSVPLRENAEAALVPSPKTMFLTLIVEYVTEEFPEERKVAVSWLVVPDVAPGNAAGDQLLLSVQVELTPFHVAFAARRVEDELARAARARSLREDLIVGCGVLKWFAGTISKTSVSDPARGSP